MDSTADGTDGTNYGFREEPVAWAWMPLTFSTDGDQTSAKSMGLYPDRVADIVTGRWMDGCII